MNRSVLFVAYIYIVVRKVFEINFMNNLTLGFIHNNNIPPKNNIFSLWEDKNMNNVKYVKVVNEGRIYEIAEVM